MMQPEDTKPKKTRHIPDTIGSKRKDNIFHWSVDELIEFKNTGYRPARVIDEPAIYEMARRGVSIENICRIFELPVEGFCNNTSFVDAHRRGRAELGSRNRALIAESALRGNLQAQIYLDRMLGGDTETTTVNVTVQPRPLESADTNDLLTVLISAKTTD